MPPWNKLWKYLERLIGRDIVAPRNIKVFLNGQIFEHRPPLFDQRQTVARALVGRQGLDLHAANADGSAAGFHGTGNALEQRRLARAIGAEKHGDCAFIHFHRRAADDRQSASVDFQVLGFQRAHDAASSSGSPI